ncbi:unnamed protein product [Dicrocoelium dendriticum]|nr:unnamed protein product [Dicrocoelium dendriticum]
MTVESESSESANLSATPSHSQNGVHSSDDPILADLWNHLDHIQPTLPDGISISILECVGVQFQHGDIRLAPLVSLAGQKFWSDVLTDGMNHWRISNAGRAKSRYAFHSHNY